MGIARTQDDSYVKEMAKWEMRPVNVNGTYVEPIPVAMGGRGGADRTKFPKMLYRAESADGGPRISGYIIVPHEEAERLQLGQGWHPTQEAAIAAVHAQHREMARLAAERAHTERWMSGKAKAEAQAVDESTMQHVPVIPETPIKRRRGRQPKAK